MENCLRDIQMANEIDCQIIKQGIGEGVYWKVSRELLSRPDTPFLAINLKRKVQVLCNNAYER